MRDVTISGYVQKDVKKTDKTTTFQISNYKGKDKDGKNQYQYVTVKVISPDIQVGDGDQVIVRGELDIFKYNEKYYTQVVAFKDGVGIISVNQNATASDVGDEYAPW